jgi:thymidylate kinase
MRGIIIDGVVASGKSSIIRYVQRELVELYPQRSKLFLSEHYTERMLEGLRENGQLNGKRTKEHIQSILETFQKYNQMLLNSKFNSENGNAELILVIERFILTHLASLKDRRGYSLKEVQEHLLTVKKYNIKQIVLVIPECKLNKRLMSTIRYRNDNWKRYLYSNGNEEQIIETFRQWQNKLINYANSFSNLIDTTIIETKNNNYKQYAKEILEKYLKDK